MSEHTAVDLFCGAGGASLGIEAAGFDLMAAVDTDTDALNTHAENLGGFTVNHDLSDVVRDAIPEADIKYVHGSPPCKGFSNANDDRDINDERNSLVFDFIEWVSTLNPRVVTMENVTGMLSISDHFIEHVVSAFRNIGYTAKYRTLNAADYGVPQTRKRVFTVAVRDDVRTNERRFPRPTHAEAPTTTLDGRELTEWMTVEEAIGDLAKHTSHRPQQENSGTSGASWRSKDEPAHTVKAQGTHSIRGQIRKEGYDGRNGPIWYPLNQPSQTITASDRMKVAIKNHETMNSDRQQLAQIEPGTAPSAAMSRVAADEPSNTIVAGKAAPPAHYRTEPIPNHEPREATAESAQEWESEKPSPTIIDARLAQRCRKQEHGNDAHHWKGARRLTVRECARLQSFPDWFEFQGSKTSQYQQAGNAVPPLLQYHVAAQLSDILTQEGE